MAYQFGDKLVSDALLDAVNGVASGKQTVDNNGKEAELKVGDSVVVGEGAHKGMTGKVTSFKNTGKSEVQLNRGASVELYNSSLSHDSKELNEETGSACGECGEVHTGDCVAENLDNFGKKKKKNWPDDKDGDGKVDEEDEKKKKKVGSKDVVINPDLEEEAHDSKSLANLIKSVVKSHRQNQFEALEVGDTASTDKIKSITPGEAAGPADDMGYDKSAGVGEVPAEDLVKMLDQGRKL